MKYQEREMENANNDRKLPVRLDQIFSRSRSRHDGGLSLQCVSEAGGNCIYCRCGSPTSRIERLKANTKPSKVKVTAANQRIGISAPNVGHRIFTEIDVMPDIAFLKAGTLDDRSWLSPTAELWCETAQPWTQQETSMQKFARMPG